MTIAFPGVRLDEEIITADGLDRTTIRADPAGLVVGFDAHERPATLRVHGPETTRVVLVGGLRCAQVLAMRAAGLGLRVVVRSSRPAQWRPFADAVNAPLPLVTVADVDAAVEPRPGQAIIVDTAAAAGQPATTPERSQIAILVRDELTAWDAGTLSWADVVILQRLTDAEAALAAKSLGIADAAADLSRLQGDTTALISQGSIHLVRLRPTAVEVDLIGHPARRYLLDA